MKNRTARLMCVLTALVLSGCDINNPIIDEWWEGGGDPAGYLFEHEYVVVSFDSGGGNYVDSINGNSRSASPQRVWKYGHASVPGLVANGNNYFTGWYTRQTGGTEWDFAGNPVTADMTLYAQWESSGGYTVDFNINFPVTGYNVTADLTYTPLKEYIADGALAAEPLQFGLRRGTTYVNTWVFTGWYKDAACIYEWVFDTDKADSTNDGFGGARVDKTITLYGRWAEVVDPTKKYTIQFYSDADKNPPPDQYVMENDPIIAPYVTYRNGSSFGGWYKDAACIYAWDFDTDMATLANDTFGQTADDNTITLYAKWAPVAEVDVLKDVDIVEFRYILFSGGQVGYNRPAANGSSTNLTTDEINTNVDEIKKIVDSLSRHPTYRVMVVGHANPATAADKANPLNAELMRISEDRAENVKKEIEDVLDGYILPSPPSPPPPAYDLVKTPIVAKGEGGRRALQNPMLSRRVEIIVFDIITKTVTQ